MDLQKLKRGYLKAQVEDFNGIEVVAVNKKHLKWFIEQAEKVESLQNQLDAKITLVNNGWEEERYILQEKVEEHNLIIDKLADIRNLFDESDMKAEGHGMEDMIASPYAVACYAENKMKRLIKDLEDWKEMFFLLKKDHEILENFQTNEWMVKAKMKGIDV